MSVVEVTVIFHFWLSKWPFSKFWLYRRIRNKKRTKNKKKGWESDDIIESLKSNLFRIHLNKVWNQPIPLEEQNTNEYPENSKRQGNWNNTGGAFIPDLAVKESHILLFISDFKKVEVAFYSVFDWFKEPLFRNWWIISSISQYLDLKPT